MRSARALYYFLYIEDWRLESSRYREARILSKTLTPRANQSVPAALRRFRSPYVRVRAPDSAQSEGPATRRESHSCSSFLGQTLQFGDNVPRYAHLAQPLYASTGKHWFWTDQLEWAFRALKVAVCTTSRHNPQKDIRLCYSW